VSVAVRCTASPSVAVRPGPLPPNATGSPLGSTRISGREQRPRPLRLAKAAVTSQDAGPTYRVTAATPVLPRHVRACQHSAHRNERWFIWTWPIERSGVQTRVPYSCNSWRCPGECARHEAAVTFARIKEAVSRDLYQPDGWVWMVLTLDRDGYYSGNPWVSCTQAYRQLSTMSRKFLKRVRRAYGGEPGSAWLAVVEAHRTGWPHINVMFYSPELARELRAEKEAYLATGSTDREAALLHGELLRHAEETGWGRQSIAEAVKDREALASYLVKLVGEVAKVTQSPVNAPVRFRRLRSGKGFLPPRRHNDKITGALLRRRRSAEGDWQILPVNPPKDERQTEAIQAAIVAEYSLIDEEETLLAVHKVMPPMPPLRRALAGQIESVDDAKKCVGFDSS